MGMPMSLLTALLVSLVWHSPVESKNTPSIRDQLPPALLKELRALEEDYGIAIVLIQSPFTTKFNDKLMYLGQPVTLQSLIADLPVFIKEWRLYPPELIKKLQIGRIFFCQELGASDNHREACMVDTKSFDIYLSLIGDRKEGMNDWIKYTLCSVLHHEIYHLIDVRINPGFAIDSGWERLNPASFKYFNLQLNQIDDHALRVTNLFPGFITRYAENSCWEDKAETFGYMMLNLHEMECRAENDAILKKKVEYIKLAMNKYCAAIDEPFWIKIRYLNRPRLCYFGEEDPWAVDHPTLPPLPSIVKPVVVLEGETNWIPTARPCVIIRRRCRCCR